MCCHFDLNAVGSRWTMMSGKREHQQHHGYERRMEKKREKNDELKQ